MIQNSEHDTLIFILCGKPNSGHSVLWRLLRCAHSDLSLIASYNAIITLREVIIVVGGRLNFKMAALPFTAEVSKAMKENKILKSTKDATKFGKTLFQRKIRSFC